MFDAKQARQLTEAYSQQAFTEVLDHIKSVAAVGKSEYYPMGDFWSEKNREKRQEVIEDLIRLGFGVTIQPRSHRPVQIYW